MRSTPWSLLLAPVLALATSAALAQVSTTPDRIITGPQFDANFGHSIAAGDVNGDGFTDVVVGAIRYHDPDDEEGALFLYLGSPTGLSPTAAWSVQSNVRQARLGEELSMGDFNGDGYDDIAAAAFNFSNGENFEGGGFVYLSDGSLPSTTPDWSFETDQGNARMEAIASAGDLNNDGYDDLVIASPNYEENTEDEDSTFDGRVWMFLGGPGGPSSSPDWTRTNVPDTRFGSALGSAGDVNNDGYDDLLVGADLYSNDQENEGRTFLFKGSGSGLGGSPSWVVESNDLGGRMGNSVGSAGDVNGDGYDDVIIGADGVGIYPDNEGIALVYHGGSPVPSTVPDWIGMGSAGFNRYGWDVAGGWDLNGDGFDDILVGAYLITDEAFAYLGSAAGVRQEESWTDMRPNEQFGYSVALGDVNGDGFGDVIVSAALYSGRTGRLYVYHGEDFTPPSVVANFSFNPTNPDVRETTNFLDQSAGENLTWEWDFDADGVTDSTDRNPTHDFATKGPHAVTLTVRSDEGEEDSITKDVPVGDIGVRVTQVTRSLPGFFLDGLDVDNVFDVAISWEGPPGTADFSINGGTAVTESGDALGASHTFKMKDDFIADRAPSIVRITPTNGDGFIGQPWDENVYVFDYPPWVTNTLRGPVKFKYGAGQVTAEIKFQVPKKKLCRSGCIFLIPSWVPFLDGSLGIKETFAKVDAKVSSTGSGKIKLEGKAGFLALGGETGITVGGAGDLRLGPPGGLDVTKATLFIEIGGKITKKVGIVEAIPALASFSGIPGVSWFNERATLKGEIAPSVKFSVIFREGEDDKLHFDDTNTTGKLKLKGTLEVNLLPKRVSASAWLAGDGAFTLRFPGEPLLKDVKIGIEVGAEFKIDYFFGVLQGQGRCRAECKWVANGSVTCKADCGPVMPLMESGGSTITLIDYDYDRFGAYSVGATEGATEGTTVEDGTDQPGVGAPDVVFANVFPGASPVLLETSAGRMLLWEHQDVDDPVQQSTEIAWSLEEANGWTPLATVIDDTRAEFNPVAAVDTDGNVVAVWTRIKSAAFSTPINDENDLPLFYKELEVVSAVFDPATRNWGPVTALTDDLALDTNLQLSTDGAGNLLLTWLKNADGLFVSSATSPTDVIYSEWDAATDTWSAPAAAASGLAGVLSLSSAYDGTDAFAILTRDPDGGVAGDGELALLAWDGATWTGPTTFAGGGSDNRVGQAFYDAGGEGRVFWLQDDDLVQATLSSPTPLVVRAASESAGFYGMQALTDSLGRDTVLWSEVKDSEPADLFARVYDPVSMAWSEDVVLTTEADVSHYAAAPFYASDDTLQMAYLGKHVDRTTLDVTLEGEPVTLGNIPVDGQVDIRTLERTPDVDLQTGDADLVLDPAFPQAGDAVNATLTLRNLGLLPADSFDVELWEGLPNAGLLAGTETVIGPVAAGESVELMFPITYSGDVDLVALVDAGDLIAEANEVNNTAFAHLTNLDPEAVIDASVTSGPPPLSVDLEGWNSFDPDGDPILTFDWSFGDGTESGTGPEVSHVFSIPGEYPVGLTVTDARGGIGTKVLMVEVTGAAGSVPDGSSLGDTALTVDWPGGGQVALSWGSADACGRGDSDYAVYEGDLSDFTSHAPVTCSTGGLTSQTFTPPAGDTYYLVVPDNGSWEGLYGRDGNGLERPPASAACLPQAVGSCFTCNNGFLESGEACDGANLDGMTCASLGFDAGALTCGPTCDGFDTSDCYYAGCGNGILEGLEVCDSSDLGGESCTGLGFFSGSLSCNAACDGYDTSGCFTCGDTVCDIGGGEDCISCPADCNGVQGGNPSNRYCCGDGAGDNPVDCSDPRCTASGNTCSVNPELVTSGLVLRLETDQGIQSAGGSVTAWEDLSGFGNDLASQGGPSLIAAATNGQDAVHFDGVDDRMDRSPTLTGIPVGAAPRTVFLVARYDSTGFGGFAWGTTNCNEVFGLVVDATGALTVQGWCVASDFISSEPGTGAGWLVQSAVYDGSAFVHYRDGAVIDSQAHVFATGTGGIVLGAEMDGAPFVQMDVAAVLVYDRDLSEAERWQVEGYLQSKYLGP